MSTRTFLIYLAGVTAAAVAIIGLLWAIVPAVRSHALFSAGIALMFVVLCAALFFTGRRAASSANKYAFVQLTMASVFGKMVICLIPLFAYREAAQPQDIWYVVIFLIQYVAYTAFEVWFMTRLAKI